MTKKELKEQYAQMKFPMGVFQIRNKINGKIFVDGHSNLDAIWNRHRTQLKFGSHRNTELQKDWNEFGEENFIYEILSEINQENDKVDFAKELKTLTEMYVEDLQPFGERGYNKK